MISSAIEKTPPGIAGRGFLHFIFEKTGYSCAASSPAGGSTVPS